MTAETSRKRSKALQRGGTIAVGRLGGAAGAYAGADVAAPGASRSDLLILAAGRLARTAPWSASTAPTPTPQPGSGCDSAAVLGGWLGGGFTALASTLERVRASDVTTLRGPHGSVSACAGDGVEGAGSITGAKAGEAGDTGSGGASSGEVERAGKSGCVINSDRVGGSEPVGEADSMGADGAGNPTGAGSMPLIGASDCGPIAGGTAARSAIKFPRQSSDHDSPPAISITAQAATACRPGRRARRDQIPG
jgi:hypothetical protein